jgi:predicted transposase/invertase (TIGR01784 family)
MNNPHDKLFKAAFSQPDVVASLIESLFPATLRQAIRLDSLVLTTNSYIDDELNEHFADLVYDCLLDDGMPVQIALLLEHKSYTVAHPHLQLMRYLLNRWQQDVEHGQKLTPVIPVLIYHGTDTWQHLPFAASLSGINALLRPFFPEFDYLLINLTALSDEQIFAFRNRFLTVSTALMKHRQDKQFADYIRQNIQRLMQGIATSELLSVVLPTFLYLLETTNLTGSDIVFIFSTVSKEIEAAAMNGADQLRMEGRVEVNRKLVKGALKLGMDAKTIADTFEMDLAEVVSLIEQLRQEKP